MKRFLWLTLLAAGLAVAADSAPLPAQPLPGPREPDDRGDRVPNLNGTWYLSGDPEKPCRIYQQPGSRRAEFVNEHGSRATGWIRGDRIRIPDWGQDREGQVGTYRADRIIWEPDGNYWQRARRDEPPERWRR
jgi:hypothetical protein